jgi:hypothetical protein
MRDIRLSEEEDMITWKLTTTGVYTAKSAYDAFFRDPNGSLTEEDHQEQRFERNFGRKLIN